ncbi:retinoic acid receptor RXR-gamma-like [Anneissia japonica]|uniref:retinoic acid receptor RXR-gamma-like n=1 Tax=Anneissia japonica TaxID=1529436 RepID=UPI0014257C98|nr:retinoic acid receptor RXR-gamma-like [Anneissia japonica]
MSVSTSSSECDHGGGESCNVRDTILESLLREDTVQDRALPSSRIETQQMCRCPYIRVHLAFTPNSLINTKLANWLVRCVEFARGLPQFSSLCVRDQISLFTSAWKELVILCMAQAYFRYTVETDDGTLSNSDQIVSKSGGGNCPGRRAYMEGVPTKKAVEQLQFVLSKFWEIKPDEKEYAILKMLLLLNPNMRDLTATASVERIHESIQSTLMEYEKICYPNDSLRLSHLLLLLPGVRGFNKITFENLFFRHLIGDTDMESVLVELMQDDRMR